MGAPQCAYHRPCPPRGGDPLAHRTPPHDCRVDVSRILKPARYGARPAAVRTELEAVPHASSQAVLAARFAHFTTPSCSRAGVVGLGEAGDPLGCGERGAVPGLTRSDPEPDRQMGLPGSGPSPPSRRQCGRTLSMPMAGTATVLAWPRPFVSPPALTGYPSRIRVITPRRPEPRRAA
jgi:hypothetical protein